MASSTTRLVQALNGGTDGSILESFLLDFIHGGSDSELTDESDSEDEDHGIVFDKINSSLCPDDDDDDESGGTAGPGGVQVGIASLLLLPEVNNVAVDSERPAEMEKIRNFDCKCQKKSQKRSKENIEPQHVSCSKQLDADVIWETRTDMASLTKDQRDMVLMGIIKTCMNDSEMTQSTKQINTKRKINRSTYMVNATVVCRATFCFVYG